MTEFGDIVSALFKILIGKDGWIIWTAASIVSWWIFTAERIQVFFYIALFCSIVVLLKICNAIFNSLIKLRAKHLAQVEVDQIEAKRVDDIRQRELFYSKIIWQQFYIVDKKYLDSALKLLDIEKIPQFEYSRFIKRDLINSELESEIWRTICNLRIQQEYYQQYDLIKQDRKPEGIILNFDYYFYLLLTHYKQTGERKYIEV